MATWTSQRSGNWSDDAANGTSPWNGGGNPAAGVPASGDSVTIAATHSVTFDVDQTAFAAGLAALTITGTLQASTNAGAYVLKMAGNVTGTGTLRAGTVDTPYPAGRTFTILLNGNYKLNLTGAASYQLYCLEPTNRIVALSGAEAAGQTELSVNTDVTGDIWAAGNIVRVDDIGGDADSEERVIAAGGIAADHIDVTVGLTAAKNAGAMVVLISRNVKIIGNGAGITERGIDTPTNGVTRCELRGCTYGIHSGSGHTISGTVSGCSNGIYLGSGHTISGTVSGCSTGIYSGSGHTISGTVSGCANGIYYGSGHTISGTLSGCATGINVGSGHTISGMVSGCTIGIIYGSGHTISGTVSGCSTGVAYISGYRFVSAMLSGNTRDVDAAVSFQAFNTLFGSSTEFLNYNSAHRLPYCYAESFDHDQVANAYKAWTRGGITTRQTAVVPAGAAWAYNLLPESTSYPVWVQQEIMCEPGQWTYVNGWLRKDAAMVYLPRLQLVLPTSDPLFDAALLPQVERIMTDSVNTWEPFALAYFNSGTVPVLVYVRALAQNATGNVYAFWRVARQPLVVVS